MERKVLLLNRSEEVLDVISWQDAADLMFRQKVERPQGRKVEEHLIGTPTGFFVLPSVLVLVKYVYLPNHMLKVTRKNIMQRDNYTCQYCEKRLNSKTGTIDHVLPRSRGGKHKWKNVVAACRTCNNRKDNRTPEEANMPLKNKPSVPSRQLLFVTAVDLKTYKTWSHWVDLA